MDVEAVQLHARLSSTRRRFAAAQEMVAAHLDTCPDSYVAWSGGKDSTVVAHMAHLAQPGVPIVRMSHGVDYPETVAYCADLAAQMGWNYIPHHVQDADTYLAQVSATDETDNSSYLADATAALGHQPDGWLMGLRQDESHRRKMLLCRTRGRWVLPAGHHVCTPLWRMTAADVHAYHHTHGLPLNPVYGRLQALGCPEGSQRVGFMVGGGGARMGRYAWLKRGWPAEWDALAARVPWLRDVS